MSIFEQIGIALNSHDSNGKKIVEPVHNKPMLKHNAIYVHTENDRVEGTQHKVPMTKRI